MKKTILLSIILLLLFARTANAQSTFDDKRHAKATTAKPAQITKFNYPKIQIKPQARSTKSGNRNFQMPSVFNSVSTPSLYSHKVFGKSSTGIPLYIKSEATAETAKLMHGQSVESVSKDYLIDVKGLLHINDPISEFKTIVQKTDALGQTHIKMQQVYKGIKVYGAQVVVHLNKKGQVRVLNGRNKPTPTLTNVVPKISVSKALTLIESDLGAELPKSTTAKTDAVLTVSEPEEELLIYAMDGKEVLVRHLTVYPDIMDRWEYFIDAQTGKIVDKYYHSCAMHIELDEHNDSHVSEASPPENSNGLDLNGVNRQIDTYSENGTNYMLNISKPMYNAGQSELPDNPVGGILTLDLRNEAPVEGVKIFHVTSTSNSWNDPTGVSAHYNADVSYEYFRNTFNRNSINGQGGTIISFINVADRDTNGGMDNAFWNGKAMFYGNGNVAFTPLAGSLDVGGHEMSHGVIGATANLEYRYESGAINESFADIFGTMIDRDDWLLGEDIVNTQYFSSGALRNMQNPNNGGSSLSDRGWQPKDMTEYYTGDQDNGGVHINSGICNRAYYLIATDIGKDKAEQVYYRALDNYLTVSSQFIDLRLAVIQSATDLHGVGSPEVQAAESAFDTVGITGGAPTDTDNDIPTADGDDFILSLDIRSSDANTLYISDTQATEYFPLTTTKLFRKPSVSDDGSIAIYVTEDNTINGVTLDPNNPEETVISDQSVWAAVSLSKDGTKFAAVKNDESNIVFILDLVNGDFREFELYNPTSADGVITGEVLYPDALEWDYSGQYLIYDALNRLENNNGQNIDYWDVGAMKVWDNQSNTYGDGTIQKLFSNLPEGVSIGNPSFSKTSGNILAFDYFDSSNNVYEVITANIETGEIKTVFENNKLGFPNYSKNDDKMIFDTNNGSDENILVINMASDKISPSGNATELIPNGKWGIWYTVGQRSILSSEKEITDFRFNVINPAAIGMINGDEITIELPNNINVANLVATFAHSAKSNVSVGDTAQQNGVSINDFTSPVIYTVTAEDGSTKNFTVRLSSGGTDPDPNDSDGDGVPNDLDQCSNTPAGTVVDITGCEIFSLPANNFRVLSKGEACAASNNGTIQIDAVANYNYTATLTGNGANASNSFTNTISFEDLQGGQYTICITVEGQTGYENCFDVMIAEPEQLSVISKVNLTGKEVTLNLSGGDLYTIHLNEDEYTTSESEVTLPIKTSATRLTVKTDKNCQGTYEENIDLDSTKIVVYPNPVQSGEITVQLNTVATSPIQLQLNTLDGRTVYRKTIDGSTNELKIDADMLQSGIYVLSVHINDKTETYKIIKQ